MAPAKPKRGKRSLEVIDHGDDPLIDHRGRSKPLYKRRSKRPPRPPKRWRPNAFTKLMLGTFPGVRLMVLESTADGMPYAIVGMLALIASVILATRLGVTAETLRILSIKPHWLLAHAAALVVAIFVYEFARMGASIEEETDRPKAARAAAALLLPAGVVALGAPRLIALHPQLVEASWLASMVLVVGALPGTLRCLFDFSRAVENPRARMIGGIVIALAFGIGIATVLGIDDARRAVASAAANAGFEILPKLLS